MCTCQDVWTTAMAKEMEYQRERGNEHDIYDAIAIMNDDVVL